ncbi:MAG: RNA polymerase sigma factor [Myxococcales bacterium]|nr:RNA polymerase sigma factor [Myxococcales bacterium]
MNRARAVETPEQSDAELLAIVAGGQLSALGRLYDRHHAAVLRFAGRASRNEADAEDVTHTTFLTVARIAGTYDGRASCRPWLLGIAARHLSERRRAGARFHRFLDRLFGAEPPTPAPEPALEAREALHGVTAALDAMSFEKRVVVLLFEVEGLSGEEIAANLSIPVGTVWTRLHAARKELAAKLPEETP